MAGVRPPLSQYGTRMTQDVNPSIVVVMPGIGRAPQTPPPKVHPKPDPEWLAKIRERVARADAEHERNQRLEEEAREIEARKRSEQMVTLAQSVNQRSWDQLQRDRERRHNLRAMWRAQSPEQRARWSRRNELRWLPQSSEQARQWQVRGLRKRRKLTAQRDRWILRAMKRTRNAAAVARELAAHPVHGSKAISARQILRLADEVKTTTRGLTNKIGHLPQRVRMSGGRRVHDLNLGSQTRTGRVAPVDVDIGASRFAHLFVT